MARQSTVKIDGEELPSTTPFVLVTEPLLITCALLEHENQQTLQANRIRNQVSSSLLQRSKVLACPFWVSGFWRIFTLPIAERKDHFHVHNKNSVRIERRRTFMEGDTLGEGCLLFRLLQLKPCPKLRTLEILPPFPARQRRKPNHGLRSPAGI